MSSNLTNYQVIKRDEGLKEFVKKTYMYTGGSVIFKLGHNLSMVYFGKSLMDKYPNHIMILGTIISIGGAYGLGLIKPKIETKTTNNIVSYYSENSIKRKLSYASLVLGLSFMSMPKIDDNTSYMLLRTLILRSLVFGGASLYAMNKKVGELKSFGPIVYSGMIALFSFRSSGTLLSMLFGPNMFSNFINNYDIYFAVPLFACLIAYDTHNTIQMYKDKNPDHLTCSSQLLLDFIHGIGRMIGTNKENNIKDDKKDE